MSDQDNTLSTIDKDRLNHSLVWKCFEKSPDSEEAKCCLCSALLAFRRSSTKGLWDHLKSKHKNEYLALKQSENGLVTHKTNGFRAPKRKKPKNDLDPNGVNNDSLITGMEKPQTELIRVNLNADEVKTEVSDCIHSNSADEIHPSTSTSSVATNHIIVWSSICSHTSQPTFIMCSLLDGECFTGKSTGSTLTYVLQKLGVKAEPSGCFSTGFPPNVVMDELSNLGYRAIGMVNKRADEILWTLAKP